MKNKQPLAIVMGITESWAFAAATVLLGLQQCSPELRYDVVIYHSGLTDHTRDLLGDIFPCRLLPYDIELRDPGRFARVSKMAFSRYECLGLLEDYSSVLWLDADILLKGDLGGIFETNRTGIAMYKHRDTPMSVSFASPVPGFRMDAECFNDGILLLSDRLQDFLSMREWCYEKTNAWSEHINSDQAIINLMLQQFDLKVSELDYRFNCPPNQDADDVIILHPWGTEKFWNELYHPLWDAYYSQWLKMGGQGPFRSLRARRLSRKLGRLIRNPRKVFSVFTAGRRERQ